MFRLTVALIGALALVGQSSAVITFSRTVSALDPASHVYAALNTGCTSKDQYGSNDCSLNWGSSYTLTYNASLGKTLDATDILNIKANIAGLVPINVKCPVCGDTCDILGSKVAIKLPPCPIDPLSSANTTTFTIPAADPVPIKLKLTADISLTDSTGKVLAEVSVVADVEK